MSGAESAFELSLEQKRSLAALLDEIVPPSAARRLPGAGELGLADAIEANLRQRPALRSGVLAGLAALDELAESRGAGGFAALPASLRRALLDELEPRAPGFLPALVFQTYAAYYQVPRVLEALGMEARPPHPRGYELEPGDLGLLDPVRRRPKLYRDC